MAWLDTLLEMLADTLVNVIPIAAILFVFQTLVLRRPVPNLKRVVAGFVLVLVGLTLFLVGLERALFPIGRLMAEQLSAPAFLAAGASLPQFEPSWLDYHWVLLFAFAIGFATTLAEPSLIAVAMKASEVSGGAIRPNPLRVAVALGVATGITLGVFRIVMGFPVQWFIIGAYAIVVLQTWQAPRMIVPLAFDSGGVATSTVTVPIIAALGLGLAGSVPGRDPLIDGFGLIAFACLFPIVTVMGYAQLVSYAAHRRRRSAAATGPSEEKER